MLIGDSFILKSIDINYFSFVIFSFIVIYPPTCILSMVFSFVGVN